MALPTVDEYGAPSYGALGRPVAGLIYHTPENVDPTLAQARAIARWQATTGNTSGGSYHGILGHDSVKYPHDLYACESASHWVLVRSVPFDKACGGVTSNRDPAVWAPGRYPWMQQLIPAAAYADPNKYFHQLALSGKAAQFTQKGYPVGALKAMAAWVQVLERNYGYSAILTLHRFWQANRSDPGPADFAEKVLAWYQALNEPEPPVIVTPPAEKVYTQAQVDALIATERSKVPEQITLAVEAATAPYKRRIDEFKELAGRAIS
jgi:hypothetical protein